MKKFNTSKIKIAIIVGRFNEDITSRLLSCCKNELHRLGVQEKHINVFMVPGAYELPFIANTLANKKKWDALICLGCVIKGETSHDQHVSHWASVGCGKVALKTGVPVMFGVLTTNNEKQAMARSKVGPLNRGKEVAEAAIEVLKLLSSLK